VLLSLLGTLPLRKMRLLYLSLNHGSDHRFSSVGETRMLTWTRRLPLTPKVNWGILKKNLIQAVGPSSSGSALTRKHLRPRALG